MPSKVQRTMKGLDGVEEELLMVLMSVLWNLVRILA